MADAGSFTDSLKLLAAKGLRYRTVIDLGCADGHFFLQHLSLGFFAGSICVNVEANPIYEESLKGIQDALGGFYKIAAATDCVGEVEFTLGSHPYWSSLLAENDPYWQRMNQLHQGKTKVLALTVDSLVQELRLAPPFLLKLDIQGAELKALKGARESLKVTDVVICEVDLGDFPALDDALNAAGFSLFDLTDLRRISDQSLGWLYTVYLNRKRDGIRSPTLWDRSVDQAVMERQRQRRNSVLEYNARVLAEIRKARGNA